MTWAVKGDALNRKFNRIALSRTFTSVDNIFGADSYNDTSKTQKIVYDTITAVLGPEGISVKKNMHAQNAEILGILTDLCIATMRPKDNAIEKLFYVLFNVDAKKPQKRTYWQSLTSSKKKTVHAGSPRHVPFRCTTNTYDPQRQRLSPPQIQRERHRNLVGTHRHRIIHPPSVAITIQEYLDAPKHARHFISVKPLASSMYYPRVPRRAKTRPSPYSDNRCKPLAYMCCTARPNIQ
jgi:hypothetical protein